MDKANQQLYFKKLKIKNKLTIYLILGLRNPEPTIMTNNPIKNVTLLEKNKINCPNDKKIAPIKTDFFYPSHLSATIPPGTATK